MWSLHGVYWSPLESSGLHMDSVEDGKVVYFTGPHRVYLDSARLFLDSARLCQTQARVWQESGIVWQESGRVWQSLARVWQDSSKTLARLSL